MKPLFYSSQRPALPRDYLAKNYIRTSFDSESLILNKKQNFKFVRKLHNYDMFSKSFSFNSSMIKSISLTQDVYTSLEPLKNFSKLKNVEKVTFFAKMNQNDNGVSLIILLNRLRHSKKLKSIELKNTEFIESENRFANILQKVSPNLQNFNFDGLACRDKVMRKVFLEYFNSQNLAVLSLDRQFLKKKLLAQVQNAYLLEYLPKIKKISIDFFEFVTNRLQILNYISNEISFFKNQLQVFEFKMKSEDGEVPSWMCSFLQTQKEIRDFKFKFDLIQKTAKTDIKFPENLLLELANKKKLQSLSLDLSKKLEDIVRLEPSLKSILESCTELNRVDLSLIKQYSFIELFPLLKEKNLIIKCFQNKIPEAISQGYEFQKLNLVLRVGSSFSLEDIGNTYRGLQAKYSSSKGFLFEILTDTLQVSYSVACKNLVMFSLYSNKILAIEFKSFWDKYDNIFRATSVHLDNFGFLDSNRKIAKFVFQSNPNISTVVFDEKIFKRNVFGTSIDLILEGTDVGVNPALF